jgi:hypothetical protein
MLGIIRSNVLLVSQQLNHTQVEEEADDDHMKDLFSRQQIANEVISFRNSRKPLSGSDGIAGGSSTLSSNLRMATGGDALSPTKPKCC